jgi:hypothetical protein
MKDWAKPPLDHVDPYHLGIRFVGFLTAIFLPQFICEYFWLIDLRIVPQSSDQIGFDG